MKKFSFFLTSLSLACFTSEFAFTSASNPCDQTINTNNKAKMCVQYKFKNDAGLYNLADHSNHLGDTSNNCKDQINNYFSKDEKLFDDAVRNIFVTNCMINNQDTTTYRCIGTTPGPACHKKNQPTKKIAAILNMHTKKFVAFYPTP